MLKWKPGAVVLTYVAATLAVPSLLPEEVPSWPVESLLAAAFAWAYVACGGIRSVALVWVVGIAIVYPLVVLATIGFTTYQSWPQLWHAFAQDLRVISLLAPVLAALLIITVNRRHAL